MNEVTKILQDVGVSKEQVAELIQVYRENPIAAMAKFNDLNIPEEQTMALLGQFMMNPKLIDEIAAEFGLTADELAMAKGQAGL